MVTSESKTRTVLLVVLAYALWLASAALTLWLILQMRLLFFVDLPMRMSNINPWALSSIDKFGTVGLAIAWLIFIVVTEEYFRRLVNRGLTTLTVARYFIVEGLLLGGVYLWRLFL
jgi:hypothetical protein